jgi:hypothetical protein
LAGVFLLALIAAFVSRRRGEGAVPSEAPILSLAASEKGFLAGTSDGLWVTREVIDWVRHPQFSSGRVVVTAEAGVAFAASRESIARIDTSRTSVQLARPGSTPSALAAAESGEIYFATGDGRFFRVAASGSVAETSAKDAPSEVLAMDEDGGTLYAGGLVSGLYRSNDLGESWTQILKTSLTAIVVDPDNGERILIGTPGGVLISEDSGASWGFTEMRSSISGLSAKGGAFFALGDRFLFRSEDGKRNWRSVDR